MIDYLDIFEFEVTWEIRESDDLAGTLFKAVRPDVLMVYDFAIIDVDLTSASRSAGYMYIDSHVMFTGRSVHIFKENIEYVEYEVLSGNTVGWVRKDSLESI